MDKLTTYKLITEFVGSVDTHTKNNIYKLIKHMTENMETTSILESEELLNTVANKHMISWDMDRLKSGHPLMYTTIMECLHMKNMEIEELKMENERLLSKLW